MRRLLILLFSLILILWGRSFLSGDGVALAVALRDGLLVALAGVVLFALNSRPPRPVEPSNGAHSGPTRLPLLAWMGYGVALLGGGWLAFALGDAGRNPLLPLLLWLGGLIVGLAAGRGAQTDPTSGEAVPVWSVESARRYLAEIERRNRQPAPADWLPLRPRLLAALLAGLTLLGLILRLWNFAGLPDACTPAACDAALRGMDVLRAGGLRLLLTDGTSAFTGLTALGLGVAGISQQTLLALGLLLGVGLIPLYFAAARRFVSPASALLATLIPVFSPLLIAQSRQPTPGLLLIVLTLALLALRPSAASGSAARWAGSGALAALLLWAAPPPLLWLLLLWLLVTPPPRRADWPAYWLPLAAVAVPRLAVGAGLPGAWDFSLAGLGQNGVELAARLLQDGGVVAGLLAAAGAAYLLRYVRSPQGWLWSVGFLLVGVVLLATPGPGLLLLAPAVALLGLAGAVALDQLVGAFVGVWGIVLPPRRVWTGAAVALSLLLAVGGAGQLRSLAEQDGAAAGAEGAIGAYLYRFVEEGGAGDGAEVQALVPYAILNSPATQLAARGALARSPQIIPLDPVAHLPFTGPPFIAQGMTDLLYLLSADDHALYRSLTAIYPGQTAEPILGRNGEPVAIAYRVSRAVAAAAQGLPVFYYPGEELDPLQEAAGTGQVGPLALGWDVDRPLDAPFVLVGQGALYIPEGGSYGLRIRGGEAMAVRLDLGTPSQPLAALDSSSGSREVEVALPQGFVPLALDARSGAAPVAFGVEWRLPGGEWEAIPRAALYGANLPLDSGLLARYYGQTEAAGAEAASDFGALADAPLVGWRVEPWLSGSGLMNVSQAVVWQAKIAAPVEGAYGFAVEGGGPFQLEIDGILLLNSPGDEERQTSLLLSQGWHDLALRYRPGVRRGVSLRWQPPGIGGLEAISPDFFAPLPPDVSVAERPLPPLPVAQSQPALAAQPSEQMPLLSTGAQPAAGSGPPSDLPDLPFTLVWQVGSCGADIEQFQQPRGVALNLYNELVYVADAGNRRVILRDLSDGGLVDYYTDDSFEEPFDLDVDLLGKVHLLDAVSQTIYQFEEPAGTALAQPSGTAFYRPRGMGMDLNGNFYVADTGGARVVKLAAGDGSVELQVGGPDSPLGQGQPVDALVLPTGAFFAVTAQDGTLWRLDTGESWPAVAPANTFDAPHFAGLTTSNFFLSDPERRMILYFSGAGAPLGQLRSELFNKPVGIGALILEGNVLLAVSDSAACQLSLWRAPLDVLP